MCRARADAEPAAADGVGSSSGPDPVAPASTSAVGSIVGEIAQVETMAAPRVIHTSLHYLTPCMLAFFKLRLPCMTIQSQSLC